MRKIFLLFFALALATSVASAQNKEPKQKQKNHARDILARARAANPVRLIKAQSENCGDCGQCWIEFQRCTADPVCGAGRKWCDTIIASEFCGSWDTHGCN